MFENNPLLEPRKTFEIHKPHDVKVIGISFPGDPDYPKSTENVHQLEAPFGYLYCLNVKRKAEFMLRHWLEQVPRSEDARKLLDCIMLIQDYLFDTVSMEPGYADKRENDRAEELLRDTDALADELWDASQHS
jgi:hypothetical protein